MKPRYYWTLLCLAILAGCASNKLSPPPYIPNEQLKLSYETLEHSLKKKRNIFAFDGGQAANDCITYFELISKSPADETIHNQLVKSEYLICDALNILSESLGISGITSENLDRGGELLSKLDLRSFPSSLNRASNDETHTLKSLFPRETTSAKNTAKLETDDWAFTMEVVALARINDNSFPDWIVWISDESKSGNYRGYSTLIIYDPEERERFKGTSYPLVSK